MANQQHLSDLLKAFADKDLEAADAAIVNLRVGILTGKEMPDVYIKEDYQPTTDGRLCVLSESSVLNWEYK